MAQKTNPISLRISSKTVWNSVWSEDNKSYYRLLFKDLEIKKYIKILFSNLGLKVSETLTKPQNESININIKRVSRTLKKGNVYNKSIRSLSFLKQFSLNIQRKGSIFIDSFLRKENSLKKPGENWVLRYKSKLSLWESKLLFSYIPAQFFSDFIVLQIKFSSKYRNEAFKFGVQAGIQSLISYYYNSRSKNFVSGIKVICKGRWTKTGTGRTQKIILNLGRLNNQAFSSFIDSYISTSVTKFGACSIKVLISYNKIDRRF